MRISAALVSFAMIAVVALAGCGHAQHDCARSIDPGQLATEPGWLVAAPTPEIRQRAETDCGPAALAMVAGRWLVTMTLDEAVAAVPTPAVRITGTRELLKAAQAHGLDAYAVHGDRDIIEYELRAHRPVIIGLAREKNGELRSHFVVAVGLRLATQQVVTIDPGLGWRVLPFADLDTEWQRAGRPALVVVGRTPMRDLPR